MTVNEKVGMKLHTKESDDVKNDVTNNNKYYNIKGAKTEDFLKGQRIKL